MLLNYVNFCFKSQPWDWGCTYLAWTNRWVYSPALHVCGGDACL